MTDAYAEWPCSVQQRSYLARERLRGRVPYNSMATFTTPEPIADETLTDALRGVAARHPLLRAAVVADGPVLTVHDEPVVDHATVGCGSADEVRAAVQGEWDVELPRDRPPLWRSRQYVLPGGSAVLALTFDHLVFDGLSRSIVVNELRRGGGVAPRATYREFALWQEREFATDGEGVRFWREMIIGAPVRRPVPLPFVAPDGVPSRGAVRVERLAPDLSSRCHSVAREHKVSIVVLLLAALYATLSDLSGERDLTVRVPVHGRPAAFLRVVGWFANDTFCRVRTCRPGDALAMLPELAAIWSGLLRHQAVPIEMVESGMGVGIEERARERPQIVTFNALGEVGAAFGADGAQATPAPTPPASAPSGVALTPVVVPRDAPASGLYLNASTAAGGVLLQCSFDVARYSPDDVAGLLGEWRRCLARACGD